MEGFLQSLKTRDPAVQAELATMVGLDAWHRGQVFNYGWKTSQLLWLGDTPYKRDSLEYSILIEGAFTALYNQNKGYRDALRESFPNDLRHKGVHDITNSVLTVAEYLGQLYRLRGFALSNPE
jgi:Bacteriophage protein GP30.3